MTCTADHIDIDAMTATIDGDSFPIDWFDADGDQLTTVTLRDGRTFEIEA